MSRFFSDEAYEPQSDPFNAGEPELPWDPWNAAALHDDASCKLSGSAGYEAQKKPADGYQPPMHGASGHAATGKDGNRAAGGRRPSRPVPNGQAAGGQVAGSGSATAQAQSASVPDGQAAAGGNRPAGKRRSCRTVFIIFFVLLFLAGPIMSGVTSCVLGVFGGNSSTSSDYSTDGTSGYETSEAKQKAVDTASDAVEDLLADPAFAQRIVEILSSCLESSTGRTAEELGIDMDATADWVISNVTYSVNDPYVYSSGSEVEVYLRVTGPNMSDAISSMNAEISAYLVKRGLFGLTDVVPNKEDQDHIRAIFAQVLDSAKEPKTVQGTIDLKKNGDDWTIDSDELAEHLLNCLGIYE